MGTLILLTMLSAAVVTVLVAGLALWQAPHQRSNLACALAMASVAIVQIARLMAAATSSASMELFWMRTALVAEGFWPLFWFLFSLSYARAPGRPSLLLKAVVTVMALLPLAIGFSQWGALLTVPLDSFEQGRYLTLGPWGRLLVGLTLVGLILPLINFEATLRASAGVGRWAIKFMVIGAGLLLGFSIYLLSLRLLFGTVDLWRGGPHAAVMVLASIFIALALARSRQGTVALSVSQSAMFGSVVLLLIGGYLIAAGVLAQVWVLVGGDAAELWQGLLLLVALAGLALLMLSTRVKVRLKQTIARHFFPHRYDYRQEWLRLTEKMSQQLGPDAALSAVIDRLCELFDAPRVSAWLFDDGRRQLHLAATAQIPSDQEADWRAHPLPASSLAAAIVSWDGPKVIVPSPSDTADQTASELQTLTQRTTAQLVAPLVIGDRALGLLAIGPSMTGRAYGPEELLLAGTIAQQSAAAVLAARLMQDVMRERETAITQLYSTFLIHDLKNLGTTLSLVAQNLSQRYADAKFREDARRVINETVNKITEMTKRVTTLRQDHALALEMTDLNELAQDSLRTLNGAMASAVTFEPTTMPPVNVDRRQLRSVLTNLLLNAREATRHATGRIRLSAELRDGWASLSVIDDGCGMSQEFIDQHLFQPFRSTKPGGLGIGLYQSREIVEAHGGHLTVKSQTGKGTTVTISLPTQAG
jgi:putative PEP-CTERM system histidine kinase